MSDSNVPRTGTIGPEDYVEPSCVLCGDPYGTVPEIKPVPQQRIIEKMDGAERHLLYWLEEARLGHDLRGPLMVEGELVGHYRKMGERDNALAHGEEALRLVDELDFGGTISAGTTYVNVATALDAFGEHERAIGLFERARAVYEASPATKPELLGGLYNNMALTCVDLGRYAEAAELYGRALAQMEKVEGGELERAITLLNMADALVAEQGMEAVEGRVFDLLDEAYDLFDATTAPRDGYYAFVCEKCAPVFSHYGSFLAADDLSARAAGIYARVKDGEGR
ncbi:MAG: tetratricopeptide repeat protein [Coriobacteriaceae bacterium]|nr:tetratricopeptide repeat protein [Coriobacteriaceae bacterium]